MRLVFTCVALAAMAAACSDATTTTTSSSSSGTSGTSGTSGGSTTEDASTTTSSSSGGATPTTWENTVVQGIVASKCATSGCHNGTQRPNFSNISEADMKATTKALSEVQAGTMPKRGSLTAAEKAAFIAFYD